MDFTIEQREAINKQVKVVKDKLLKSEKASVELREEVTKLKNMGSIQGSSAQEVLNGINLLRGEWYEKHGEA